MVHSTYTVGIYSKICFCSSTMQLQVGYRQKSTKFAIWVHYIFEELITKTAMMIREFNMLFEHYVVFLYKIASRIQHNN